MLFFLIVSRLFTLQILNGESYENDFTLSIEKKKVLKSTRGEIFDCNGNLLAYNELIYEVTFEDKGSYADNTSRNLNLNGILYTAIKIIESHGDTTYNNFKVALGADGNYVYTVKGFNLSRFKADFFGYRTIDEMTPDEADISAPDLIALMCSDKYYGRRRSGTLGYAADPSSGEGAAAVSVPVNPAGKRLPAVQFHHIGQRRKGGDGFPAS